MNVLLMKREQRYKISLWLASLLFFVTCVVSFITIYHAYGQYKSMEKQEQRQFGRYQEARNKFEIQKEYVMEMTKDSDFIEYVARERIPVTKENEMLFRFE